MKKFLKLILSYFLTKDQINILKKRLLKLITFKKEINTNYVLNSFGKDNFNTFFGYYDISPFSPNENKIIYLSLENNSNVTKIVLYDFDKNSEEIVSTTRAWNWQQGSRLRWVPNSSDSIMFNDFIEGKYVTRIININTKHEKRINFPLYDIDSIGKRGITLNFERLGALRPGYGYLNREYIEPQTLDMEGIDIVDLETGKIENRITYSMINKAMGNKINNYSNYYINHLSFSPLGDKFLFFWINIKDNGIHQAELWVYDINEVTLKILENNLSVSHYDWIDNERIIVTAYNEKRECRYYIYNTKKGERTDLLHDLLKEDGHPTWLGNNKFITDTYPDKYGFQKILYVNIEQRKVETLLDIYSSYKVFGEKRCDLHPRINLKNCEICFDANVKGNRKLYMLRGWSLKNEDR